MQVLVDLMSAEAYCISHLQQTNDSWQGKTEMFGDILLQCHMVYHVMNVCLCDEILEANYSSCSKALDGPTLSLQVKISSKRFEVLTVVLWKILVCWDVAL
jgi:hypothetical protein